MNKVTIDVRPALFDESKAYTGFSDEFFASMKMEYFIVINGEEVQVTRDMAYGLAGFMDDTREDLHEQYIGAFHKASGHDRKTHYKGSKCWFCDAAAKLY